MTVTPTQTPSATAFFTVTSSVPQIRVSVPTNCRVGPGKVYDLVGALLVGEVAQVIARDPTGNYFYIPNPDSPGDYCWVWGEYATISGSLAGIPIYFGWLRAQRIHGDVTININPDSIYTGALGGAAFARRAVQA